MGYLVSEVVPISRLLLMLCNSDFWLRKSGSAAFILDDSRLNVNEEDQNCSTLNNVHQKPFHRTSPVFAERAIMNCAASFEFNCHTSGCSCCIRYLTRASFSRIIQPIFRRGTPVQDHFHLVKEKPNKTGRRMYLNTAEPGCQSYKRIS